MNQVQFANRLLRNCPEEALALLAPELDRVEWTRHAVLLEPEETITHVIFPENAVISLVSPQLDGREPELATIGREGLAGCIAAIGSRETYSRWLVQVPGRGIRCPSERFNEAFQRNSDFRQLIVCYMEALLCQTLQSVACNALHPVEARCCRWILMMHDRSDGDELPLTHEFLAEMLSVHRSSVTIAAAALQRAGFIQSRRGSIRVLDRAGLEGSACACYRLVRDRYERLIPGTMS